MKKSVFVTKNYRKIDKIFKNFAMRMRDSMNFILNSFYLCEAVQQQLLLCKFVAEATSFHLL